MGFPGNSDAKEFVFSAEDWSSILGQEDLPENGIATCSSILALKIPWTEEPEGLQSMGRKELDTTKQLTLLLLLQT